jgi:hypothetical protein
MGGGGGGGKGGGGKGPLGIVGSVLGSVFQDEPEMESAPPPPQYISTAAAEPEPATESTAAEVATQEPVIDTEAARIRADKRRRATQEAANALISLVSNSPTTKATSLLGE